MNEIITSDAIIAENTSAVVAAPEQSYVEKLTNWVKSIGYKQEEEGHVSKVALLGLIGEAGEVVAETDMIGNGLISRVVHLAELCDGEKKMVRKDNPAATVQIVNPEKFAEELSDSLYYHIVLALNKGLTIEDLARISYNKVVNRNKTQIIR